ncbi:MAG: pYEATS domain-containing protein [Rheinheimera sp.]|nr:pYEATS domain-containing protein [Rheinheimera sp.]
MNNEVQQLEHTLARLQSGSRISIALMLIGAVALVGSVVYAATRLAPLEREIAQKQQQLDSLDDKIAISRVTEQRLSQQIAEAEQQLSRLKANVEKLYAVKVTAQNHVFELKATAKATGRSTELGPEYDFNVFINAPQDVLTNISQVDYLFAHPTFREKLKRATDVAAQFQVGYRGWGCLTQVTATVHYHTGAEQTLDFNMCKSLGPQWTGSGCYQDASASELTKRPVTKHSVSKLDKATEDCDITWNN